MGVCEARLRLLRVQAGLQPFWGTACALTCPSRARSALSPALICATLGPSWGLGARKSGRLPGPALRRRRRQTSSRAPCCRWAAASQISAGSIESSKCPSLHRAPVSASTSSPATEITANSQRSAGLMGSGSSAGALGHGRCAGRKLSCRAAKFCTAPQRWRQGPCRQPWRRLTPASLQAGHCTAAAPAGSASTALYWLRQAHSSLTCTAQDVC